MESPVHRHEIHAHLGDIVAGRIPGRQRPGELIICDLTGLGAQDVLIATIAYERIGTLQEGGWPEREPRR